MAGLAVAVAFAALVRPSDSLWLVLPLGLAWLAMRDWRRLATGGAIVVGQIVGWAPWVIESFFRFGGPFNRLYIASDMVGGTHLYPDLAMVQLYVKLWSTGTMGALSLDVPLRLRGGAATVSTAHLAGIGPVALLWWLAAAVAVAVGVLGVVRARRTAADVIPFLMPLFVGLTVAFPYLFMMRYGQLRFLLPAVGLLMLPVAYGVLQLGTLRLPRQRLLGPVLATALVLGLAGVQMTTALGNRAGLIRGQVAYTALIDRLRELGVSEPCAVAGDGRFNVAYQLGCDGLGSRPGVEEPEAIRPVRDRGQQVAVVLRAAPPAGTFLDGWQVVKVPLPGRGSWSVYLSPA